MKRPPPAGLRAGSVLLEWAADPKAEERRACSCSLLPALGSRCLAQHPVKRLPGDQPPARNPDSGEHPLAVSHRARDADDFGSFFHCVGLPFYVSKSLITLAIFSRSHLSTYFHATRY